MTRNTTPTMPMANRRRSGRVVAPVSRGSRPGDSLRTRSRGWNWNVRGISLKTLVSPVSQFVRVGNAANVRPESIVPAGVVGSCSTTTCTRGSSDSGSGDTPADSVTIKMRGGMTLAPVLSSSPAKKCSSAGTSISSAAEPSAQTARTTLPVETSCSGARGTRPAKPGPSHHDGSSRGASPEAPTTRPSRNSVQDIPGWRASAGASLAGIAAAARASSSSRSASALRAVVSRTSPARSISLVTSREATRPMKRTVPMPRKRLSRTTGTSATNR